MNAEARAKDLTNAMSKKLHVRVSTEQWNGIWEISRKAIVSAENDKLEEAAQRLERIDNSGLIIIEIAPSSAAELIRSLKSKD